VTAETLHAVTRRALKRTGMPAWDAPEMAGERDVLAYLADEPDGAVWALVPEGDGERTAREVDDAAEIVALDPEMAAALIGEHVRGWLAARLWQVQMRTLQGRRQWRLVDCLATIDGGGDRLEGDYPCGEDELDVLCASVTAVAERAIGS
jgi:hypothetical protein